MPLTPQQNEQLAAKLRGTTRSAYAEAKALFSYYFDDEDFDRLKAETGLFRCEGCGKWFPSDEEYRNIAGSCKECVDASDGTIGDDDDED